MKTNIKMMLAVSGFVFFAIVACKEEPKKDTAMTEE